MSTLDEPGFGLVRKSELDLIKTLKPRARPRAIAVMVAIRSILQRRVEGAFSDRDFREFGLAREAAAGGLVDCISLGLLEIISKGTLTGRGHKTKYRIVHSKASSGKTAGKPANNGTKTRPFVEETAGKPASNGRETKPFNKKTAGKPDTTKDTPAPAEQEQGAGVSSNFEAEAEHQARMEAQKDRARRIERSAKRIGWTDMALIRKAGGPSAADFLCRKLESGQFTEQQFRARLVEGDERALDREPVGPAVLAIAIGDAF